MNIKDLNFVAPEIAPIKPNEGINLSSPINFFKNVENIPGIDNNESSSYDWRNDLTKYVMNDSASKVRESYYNAKQYEKYHSALFNKPIFKDPSYYDNEELNAERQGFLGELFNGAVKMHSSFLSSFVSTFNPVGYDNKVSNAMMDYSEKMENLFPNFYSKDERDNPMAFRNIMSGNFIGDKLVKNIGFMQGAMAAALLQDVIIGTMTGGSGLLPTLTLQAGRAANWLQKAFKAETIAAKLVTTGTLGGALTDIGIQGTKALEYFNTMSKGQKILTQAKSAAFLANAAHGEAAIEALEGYRSIKEDLIKQHIEKYGEVPNALEFEEIEKLATESANIRYGLNFATIFLADGIQFASLFKPLKAYTVGETLLEGVGRNADNLILDSTGKLVAKEFTKSQKIANALTGELMRDNISEMFQEGLQYSFDKAASSYAQKKWNKDVRGGLSDYLYEQGQGLKAMVQDQEGQESMLLGFLTGFVAHGFKKGVQKIRGIDNQLEERQQYIIENFNQIDFNKLFDVKSFDDMVARDTESFNGRTMQEIILHQMRDAISKKDVLSFKSLQHELLFNAIRTSNALGKFDAFIEKLETLKQLPDEDFKNLFGLDKSDSRTVEEYVDRLKEESIKLKDLINQIDSSMPNPYEQNSIEWVAFNDMKDSMSFHLSFIKHIDSRLDSVTNKLLEDNPTLTEDLIYNLSDSENFNQKFLQPLNEQRKQLFESYKIMSELKEGRDENLFKQTKQELESIDRHIDLLNQHIGEYSEANKAGLTEAEIGSFKNVVLEVLRYNHEKYTGQPFSYTQTQLEDTLSALIDFQKLKTSLGSVVAESNKLQTLEGRAKFMEEHMKFLNRYSQNFMDAIKKVNFKNLKKYKEEHLSGIKNEITSNLSEVQKINEQLQELNSQLIEADDKETIQKQIDELTENKKELIKQNSELEKVTNSLENDKDLDDGNLPQEKSEEDEQKEDEQKDIVKTVEKIETITPISETTVDIELDDKLDDELEKILSDKFNGRVHFLRTTDVEEYDKPEKDGKGGRTRRFQLFLEQFGSTDGIAKHQKLNKWLEDNKLKFVIRRPTDEMYDNRTFDEPYKNSSNESKSAVLVLVNENNIPVRLKDNKIDESGDFVAEVLPKSYLNELTKTRVNGKIVERTDDEIRDLSNKKWSYASHAKLHALEAIRLRDIIKNIETKDGYVVNISPREITPGIFRFMANDDAGKVEKQTTPVNKSILNNPSSELFVNTSEEDLKIGNFTLQKGRLYLKIVNDEQTYFYFPISLGEISGSKTGDNVYSLLQYVFQNHKTLREEKEPQLIAIEKYLESVLYDGVNLKLPNGDVVFIDFKLNTENPKFEVYRKKGGTKVSLKYSLDNASFDKKTLFNILEGVTINSKALSKEDEFTLPTIQKDNISFEKLTYSDFISEQTNASIPFKINLSKGFDRVKQAIFFNLEEQNELLKSDSQVQPDNNDVKAQKADIERIEIPRYFTFNELGGGKGKSGAAMSSVEADRNQEIAENFKKQLQEGDKLIEPNGTVTYFRNGKVVKEDGSMYGMVDIPAFTNGVTIERSKVSVFNKKADIEKRRQEVERLSNKELTSPTGKINTGKIEIPILPSQNIDKTIYKDNKGAEYKVKANFKNLQDVLLGRNGKYLFRGMQGRFFVLAKVGDFYLPFYISSAGTSGKKQGEWYPFFGYTGNWLVKGRVGNKGEMEYSQKISEVQKLLQENLQLPSRFLNLKGEMKVGDNVIYDINQDFNYIEHFTAFGDGTVKREGDKYPILKETLWIQEITGFDPRNVNNDGKGSADSWIKDVVALTEDVEKASKGIIANSVELDVETSSIAKDVLSKGKIYLKEEIKSDNPSISTDSSTLTQDVAKETPKEKKKFNKNNDSTPLFSSKKIPVLPSLNVTETDIEKVRSLFPHEVNIKNLFNIANSDAWATWSQSAITLFKGATRADLYHEAWHHFSQLYLTKDEKVKLYEETRNRVKELAGKSDLEVEEYIAREFAKFTETGKIEGNYPERKSIFQKIMDFLKSIFSNETDLSLNSLFNNLYKGQVNPLNYSTDNIMFGKLNSSINDNFSASEADILFSALDALKSQLLKEYNVSDSEMYKIKNVNRIYNEIQDHIIELYEKSENPIITSKLEKVLDNWEDVKKAHLEYVSKQRGIKSEVEIDENGQLSFKEINEDEKQGRNSADFSEASERTIYELMDNEVQSLIRNLVDKDEKGKEIVDPIFGLPRLVDFSKYVELLKDSFNDSQDFDYMVEKMNELSKKYPSIKDLIDRLFINESDDVKLLRIQFASSFGLVNKSLIEAHITEEGIIVSKNASNSKKSQVEYDLAAYFFKSPETNLISKVEGENIISSDKIEQIQKYNLLDTKGQLQFLKDIGLNIEQLYKEMDDKDKKQLFNPNSFLYLRNHIVKYLEEKKNIKNIVEALQTPLKDTKTKETKIFKKLVELNQKYLSQYISGSYLNVEGKLENSKVQWSTQDKIITKLKNAKNIQDLFDDPNFRHLKGFLDGSYLDIKSSKLLSYLFDQSTGVRKNSYLSNDNYSGISSAEEGKDGKKTKAMYGKDKMISDILMFAQSNRLTTMQLSNKATHHTFQFNSPIVQSTEDFIDTMYNYLLDELQIIKQFNNGDKELTKLKKLSSSIKDKKGDYQFAIFKDIINKEDAKIFIEEYLKNDKLSKASVQKAKDYIKSFIIEERDATYNMLGDFILNIKTDSDRYKNASKELIIQDYIQNQFVFNIELSKLIYGNPYMHTDPYKRIAGASSAGRSILSSKLFLDYYNQMTTTTQRSKVIDLLQEKVEGEYKLQTRKSEKEVRYFVVKDREIKSDYYESILSIIDKEIEKNPDSLELKEKRIAIKKAYEEVNGSDAMGAVTLDSWRKFLFLSGRWNFHTLEPFYQKVVNWDYYNRLMKAAKDSQQELEYFTEREKYNITDEEMVNVAILKYQYYGTVENQSIAEKAFHKFQLMPLIPQVIEGKNWSNHLDRMIYEDVDYMMFASAAKLEQDSKMDDFYLDSSNITSDFNSHISKYQNGVNSYNIKTGYLDNLKEQVFMENGTDNSLLFGTQVRKLLFVSDDFSELYDEFRETIQSLTQIEKDNLMLLSGLDEEGRVTDNQKFVKFLLDEIDKKTVNKNVKEYLRLTNSGNFAHSLDTNIQRQPIESIINSVVNSRLVKQKMHGEMLVQISNVGFESLEDGKGLKFYEVEKTIDGKINKVRKMQVKVPLTGKFKNLLNLVIDGQKVETRERLNQLIKEGKIDTRSITMVGYRIPTQEHNSMEIMEVEEFLHPSLNGIVVPYEITAKAGSDFDIDKLNIFKPHISKNGKYIESKKEQQDKLLTFIEHKLNQYENYINKDKIGNREAEEKLTNAIFGELENLDYTEDEIEDIKLELSLFNIKDKEDLRNRLELLKDTKQSHQNKVIEIFEKVLLDPSNYLNLITPNSTFMFDEAMDNIFEARFSQDEIQTKKGKKLPKDLNMTKSLLPRSSWLTKAILDEAGQALGIAAVGNTFTQLIQKSKVEFTDSYLEKYNLLFKPESISKRTLSNGLSKATAYSQLINIYVDIANDPRAGYLNMGDRVTPIINTMINMGLPIDTILYFINQPIIRDFVEFEGMVKNSMFTTKEEETSINEYTGELITITKSTVRRFLDNVTKSNKYFFGTKPDFIKEKGANDHTRFVKGNNSHRDITDKLIKEEVYYDFSNEELKNDLLGLREGANKSEKEVYSKKQLLLLSQYLQLSEISSDYRQLQSSMNFDTNLAKDGFDSEQREKLFKEISEKQIFTNLDVLKNKTVIAPLNISKELKNLNQSLLPLVNSPVFYDFISDKLSSVYQFSSSKVKNRFVRTFKNDLIMYIFQNFLVRSETSLMKFNETFAPVIGDYNGKPNEFGGYLLKNLYREMIDLIESKPKLTEQYTLLKNLFIVSEERFKNIGLSYFNKDSQLQNSYIDQFKELLNHEDLEVRDFMLKFAYMSFFQSGLNKSFISSSDIIPANIFASILDSVREQYYKEVNSDEKQSKVLNDFFTKFLGNNDRFRLKEDNRGKPDKNITGVKSDKFKWYVSDIDKVLNNSENQPAITKQIDKEEEVNGCEPPY